MKPAAVKNKGLMLAILKSPYATDDNHMVSPWVLMFNAALETCCKVGKDRDSVYSFFKVNVCEFIRTSGCKLTRKMPLMLGENVNGKVPRLRKGLKAHCVVSDAPKHQRRVD